MGRPLKFSPEIAETICERIALGESLRSICNGGDLPDVMTVIRWLTREEPALVEFRLQYARAREVQADTLFEQCLDISDESKRDTYVDEDGNERTNHEVVNRSRLRVDTRKWMAGKLRPKVYGDKTFSEAEINLRAGAITDKPLTDEEFEATHCTNDAPKPQSNGHANGHGSGNGKAS